MSIDHSTRYQLTVLARRPWARITEFRKERPTKWRPWEVRNPADELSAPFTEASAWELIASKLENGHDVEVVELRKPKGKRGYVMRIELEPAAPKLYVKLELGSGRIFGRSFHYSTHE